MKKHFMFITLTVLVFSSNYSLKSANSIKSDTGLKMKFVLPEVNLGSPEVSDEGPYGLRRTLEKRETSVYGLELDKEYRGKNYKSGVMDNYYNFKLDGIKKIRGVYSHYKLFSKISLVSGSTIFKSDEEEKYNYRKGETFYFSNKLSTHLESSFYLNANLNFSAVDFGSSMNVTTTDNITRSYSYYYSSKVEISESINLHSILNKEIAENYCPDNYAITIGDIGTFYEIDFQYRNVVKTWFGDKKDSYKSAKLLLVNESELIRTLIYDDLTTDYFDKYFAI